MYADFFLDQLCTAAPVMQVFKKGLEAIDYKCQEIDLIKDKSDSYAIAADFFSELHHPFDDIELHYIYQAIYAQAGAAESINYITQICGEENISIVATENLTPQGRFYDIKINFIATEYCYNMQLLQEKLKALVEDLLWYNGVKIGLYSIFFNCQVFNSVMLSEQVHIVNDKYVELPIDIFDNDRFVVRDLNPQSQPLW